LPESLPFSTKKTLPVTLPGFNVKKKEPEAEIPFFDIDSSSINSKTDSFEDFQKKGPLFIRTDDYSKMLDCISSMKEYVKESPDIVLVLKNIKKNNDLEHRKYIKLLEDIQRKLVYIDNLLFEAVKE
jgi:hypothetical protein